MVVVVGVLAVCAVAAYAAFYLLRLVSPVDLHYHDNNHNRFLVTKCRQLQGRYWPTPWIFSGHLDAIVMMRMRPAFDPRYHRERLRMADGTTLLIDWAEAQGTPKDAPLLILFSGVTGNSRSSYITYLIREGMAKGWRCVVMNFPGTQGEKLTGPRPFSIPSDIKAFVEHVHSRYPSAPKFALGFSLGGHLLTKYVGSEGDSVPLRAAIVCSSPWSQAKMTNSWQGFAKTKVYGKHFIQHFLKIYHNNQHIYKDHKGLDHTQVTACKTVFDLEKHIFVPLSTLKSKEEYYKAGDSTTSVKDIHIPMLIVHAMNDPVVAKDALPVDEIKKKPKIILAVTNTGGHGGWCMGMWPVNLSWLEKLCVEYIDAHLAAT